MERPNDKMPGSEMMIYITEDGLTKIETTFDGDTVWLSADQMAELFQRDNHIQIVIFNLIGFPVSGSCCKFCNN